MTMTLNEVMAELEKLGTEQNRKIYARHGADPSKLFGVSFANLQLLAKRIKRDQPLAEQLWATGNFDARSLATLVADPQAMPAQQVDDWAQSLQLHPATTDYFVKYVAAQSPHRRSLAQKWMKSRAEFVLRCGFHTAAAVVGDHVFSADEYRAILAQITARIHTAPNRAKEGMHNALIAIGGHPELKDDAIAAAKAIGPVDIDHGETSCKTPDAVAYIEKIHARGAKKQPAQQKPAKQGKPARQAG